MKRMRIRITSAACVILAAGCVTYKPPSAQVRARQSVQVTAGFADTWNAVIDVFADRNIPISTIDRSSGFIATTGLAVGYDGMGLAACGSMGGIDLFPTFATYNVVVRGDSVASTIKVTARFTSSDNNNRPLECISSGDWERESERLIKRRAEHGPDEVATSAATQESSGPKTAKTAGRAQLRKGPGGDLIEVLEGGRTVVILATEGEWVRVAIGTKRGYIRAADLFMIK